MFAVFAYKTKISVFLKSDSKKMYCEAKRSGSDRERKYFPIQQGLILKFAFKPEKLPGLSRNRPPIGITKKGFNPERVVPTLRIYQKASSFNFALFFAVGLLAALR